MVTLRSALVLVLVGLAATACAGESESGNKAGAEPPAKAIAVTLHLPDAADVDGRFFADALARRSGGSIAVRVDGETYASDDPQNEAQLAAALADGSAELGYLPARNWAPGLPAFAALQTPFLVTSSAASDAVATGAVGGRIVASLDAAGVVGIGLVAHEPRRLLTRQPVLDAADYQALRIRIVDHPQTAALVEALGALPVEGLTASAAGTALARAEVDGLETSPEYIETNHYEVSAPYLSAYAIAPKFETIVASTTWWGKLSAKQQKAVREAASDTVAHAHDIASRERDELAALCRDGVILTRPSAAMLDELAAAATAAAPDRQTTPWVAAIRAAVPPSADQALDVPPSCAVTTSTGDAVAAQARAAAEHAPPASGSASGTFPNGTFVTTTSVEDMRAGGSFGREWETPITWTFAFADGHVHESQKPEYPDQPACDGTYTTDGDLLMIHWEERCGITDETTRWSYYDGQLTFVVVQVADSAGKVLYAAHPWRRVD